MRFLGSARKHGIRVEDIAHALRVPVRLVELEDARTLVLARIGRVGDWRWWWPTSMGTTRG